MGKKNRNKSALNSEETTTEVHPRVTKQDLGVADGEEPALSESCLSAGSDPYEVPFYSRQAAFALLWLLVYSFGMFTLPFAAFFGTRHILTHNFHIEGFANTCGSVLAAVLMVNVIIVLYALKGFKEAEEDAQEEKKRKEQSEGTAGDAKDESKKSK